MAVTLIVEDGTGRSDANTLVSLAGAKSYWDERGTAYSAFTDDVLNAAIVRSCAFLANAFRWQGLKVNMRTQTMPWPRFDTFDRDGWSVLSTEIPREVIAAACEIAIYEAANPGAMTPSVVLADKVQSEQVGSIRVEYANVYSSASASRPVLVYVNDLLFPFLATDVGVSLLRV